MDRLDQRFLMDKRVSGGFQAKYCNSGRDIGAVTCCARMSQVKLREGACPQPKGFSPNRGYGWWTGCSSAAQGLGMGVECGNLCGNKLRLVNIIYINQYLEQDLWRREWDSNPRYDSSPYTRSPGARLRPLGHPSGAPVIAGWFHRASSL